jgi:hypothetical protein
MPEIPNRICFMVMPFGEKKTALHRKSIPRSIDFDVLWKRMLEPLIRDIGYEPVRADADLGASIIREMIERLALSDLVLADMTLPNANVFYEVGIRHAARETGCVLLAANWTEQPFDTQAMRFEPYALTESKISEAQAGENRRLLSPRIKLLAESKTPCFEMEGFPNLPVERAQAFREWLARMSAVNAKIAVLRSEPPSEARRDRAMALVKECSQGGEIPQIVAFELLKLLRDTVGWKETIVFIDTLPPSVSSRPVFAEQRALAQSKNGSHLEAIAGLEALIKLAGSSPERQGLVGGRYKKLWRETRAANPPRAEEYLDAAIEHYESGRILDLNDYYASSNLPLLLNTRNAPGDRENALRIAAGVVAACERAIDLKIADEWVYPTLLGAAFAAADVAKARELARKVRNAPKDWKLETALDDLRDIVALLPEGEPKQELAKIETSLRSLV